MLLPKNFISHPRIFWVILLTVSRFPKNDIFTNVKKIEKFHMGFEKSINSFEKKIGYLIIY